MGLSSAAINPISSLAAAQTANSARAGFLPIHLERLPLAGLAGIDIYIKTQGSGAKAETFTLFSAGAAEFTEEIRHRLLVCGVKLIYIPIARHTRFRLQTEASLSSVAQNPNIEASVKAEIVYQTSVELVNEMLAEPDLAAVAPRLESISRAITTLVLNDPAAFSHLFAAARHDFYTAAHMVNVATWMVPLAYAVGYHDADELNRICQAGLLHDIGKTYIPAEILNKHGTISAADWQTIRRHPELGYAHLSGKEGIHPMIAAVAWQHHERMDGTGYPRKLAGEQIDPISRICAVVDSFDAMTAFRPFKERTLAVPAAIEMILKETPGKYDAGVVQAWIDLMKTTKSPELPVVAAQALPKPHGRAHREFERFRVDCQARLHILENPGDTVQEKTAVPLVAHNISRSGLGMISQQPISPGQMVRVYVMGESSLKQVSDGSTVYCRQYQSGWYEIGMKFISAASGATLQDSGSFLKQAS